MPTQEKWISFLVLEVGIQILKSPLQKWGNKINLILLLSLAYDDGEPEDLSLHGYSVMTYLNKKRIIMLLMILNSATVNGLDEEVLHLNNIL